MPKKLLTGILYLLAVCLISEWIYPFSFLTETDHSIGMIIFDALSLGSFFLGWRFYYTIPLHLILIYVFLSVSFDANPLDPAFFSEISKLLVEGFTEMISFNAAEIDTKFIFAIFFIALWLLDYITAYCLLKKQRILSILALTVTYIAIINTFTDYKGEIALVRTVILGFLLLHFALASRIEAPGRIQRKGRSAIYHLCFLAALTGFLVVSLFLPSQKPIFKDPVPYIRETLGMNTTRTVGYSEDDTELGGALQPDYSKVFEVTASKPHYWRVEAKRTYTGKGWANTNQASEESFAAEEEFPVQLNDAYSEKTGRVAVRFEASNDYLVYAYGTQKVLSQAGPFDYNQANEKVTARRTVKNYSLEIKEPVYDVRKMKGAAFDTLSDGFVSRYTQLPDNLPKRVQNLAERITKDADTNYEKAKAIENYMSFTGQFRYSTEDAQGTGRDADYVDQFLFETKVGYCDNFASSMVVMLRSIGIPARFAKGFTAGTEVGTSDGNTVYRVQNNNAHSWPEVYFPGTGWVPFEPTATFQNPETFTDSTESARQPEASNPSQSETDTTNGQTQEQQQNQAASKANEQEQKNETTSAQKETATNSFKLPSFTYVILLGLALLLTAVLLVFRKQIRLLLLNRQAERGKLTLEVGYLRLLKLLHAYGYRRADSETLAEFAERVDISGFAKLTASYGAFFIRRKRARELAKGLS
ncbi:hypothetical protein MFLO_14102 [Listeria floridensis FSL S10-1187]|uniref:Transglutaminase-like domain-containing protein n=1 Tax=Listeria floridensis FSL S10-1187 TaxID=1265817 RepID=A0ABN0RC26_9LIST|nr:transglutaminase domain-containing protein [Listeria floridensis]EUJ26355.1 hypothetical protein MFLO_14102 [Listeria floridensis FSL S10-1187]